MGRALDSSVQYIAVREQFGRPVGSFQALQHRAANLLIQVELTRAVVAQSAALADAQGTDAGRLSAAASQAKARASAAALEVTKGCIQLHGGIGYTDECAIGLYLKKAMVGAAWLGTAAWHRRRYNDLAPAGGDEAAPELVVGGEQPIRRDELRRWLADNFPPAWRFPSSRLSLRDTREWHVKLNARGWAAPNWPKEHGGMGLGAYEQVALQSEFDRHGIQIAPNMAVVMLGPLIICYGTEAQRREILPRILSGEVRWCQGYSEPSAGSDLASLRTSAVADGDDFIVNGQKIWTTFAHDADMVFLLVRTDPQAKKQEGISFLLADMRTPGITVKRIRNIAGGAEFCEGLLRRRARAARQPGGRAQPGLDDGQVAARLRAHHPRQPQAARVRRCCGCANWRAANGWTTTRLARPLRRTAARRRRPRRAVSPLRRRAARGERPGARGLDAEDLGHRDQQRVADLMVETAGESGVLRPSLPWPAARCTRPTSSTRRGRPPSTAAATRSSATSWPRACLNCRADSGMGSVRALNIERH
jgi:alkylation response protein AidB-like acyl-CoA dehydrogenase